jgi:hypothetical protein
MLQICGKNAATAECFAFATLLHHLFRHLLCCAVCEKYNIKYIIAMA